MSHAMSSLPSILPMLGQPPPFLASVSPQILFPLELP